jgi:hypothetical protein
MAGKYDGFPAAHHARRSCALGLAVGVASLAAEAQGTRLGRWAARAENVGRAATAPRQPPARVMWAEAIPPREAGAPLPGFFGARTVRAGGSGCGRYGGLCGGRCGRRIGYVVVFKREREAEGPGRG